MIAFHYPPFQGGSGVHRTLKFSKYLPAHGWQPVVLSANPRAYPSTGSNQIAEITDKVIVERAFALDTGRHLSLGGHYLRLMALPDQWANWWLSGVLKGLRLVRKFRPRVIWSTYPIATAHLIGLTIHRLTGLPWIADFRDSMTEENYPRDPWSRQCSLWIERHVVRHASRLVFTAASARKIYMERYPFLAEHTCLLIPNGYDEEDFSPIQFEEPNAITDGRPIRLVHAGLIYSEERDPRPFFHALSRLKSDGVIKACTVVIDLRASGSEEIYRKLLADLGISDIVRLLPELPYREALQDCAYAQGLLLFQAASCNHQIPAKAYEYLRLGKPILALTPKDGDTGNLLAQTGGATIIDLDNEEGIYRAFPNFLASLTQKSYRLPALDLVRQFSREYQASQLSTLLSQVMFSNE
jgi:glycosyltransferase involved in cell wall biosynthesis